MPTMTVGVLAAHDDAKHLAGRLTAELPAALGRRYENVEWHVRHAEADPADPVADERELVEATRRRALDEGWQLATEVTVTVADVADLHVITLTLVIPEMWIARGSGLAFKTMAVYVTREEPFTGKIGVPAAREQFATVNLEGEGKLVER